MCGSDGRGGGGGGAKPPQDKGEVCGGSEAPPKKNNGKISQTERICVFNLIAFNFNLGLKTYLKANGMTFNETSTVLWLA